MEINVLIDTREKKPLSFTDANIKSVTSIKLDTGDYSLAGLEDKLFIERKSSFMEFYGNITEKRFWNELDRTSTFKYKFLILEFDLDFVTNFPYGCGLPKSKIPYLKVSSSFIMSAITKILIKYDIKVIFAGNENNAIKIMERIFKDVYKTEN